ncbi:hypothetical protein JYT84_00565 [bacterium AH-315-M10]|nr:hypothetical protein [bacterium AH-315-M10]
MSGKTKTCWECGFTIGETDPRQEHGERKTAQCLRCLANFILNPRRPMDYPGPMVERWLLRWIENNRDRLERHDNERMFSEIRRILDQSQGTPRPAN